MPAILTCNKFQFLVPFKFGGKGYRKNIATLRVSVSVNINLLDFLIIVELPSVYPY